MSIEREKLYRFPWSKTDNPGGWVEVTDKCDLFCPGCYRHELEGHRPLEEVKNDIIACQKLTNCDRMAIAGGEPLIYPHIVEVVDFISKHKMKPVLLTNGEKLSWEFATELRKAGLAKFHFHVDCGMKRPRWIGKNEAEMNELRQHFADLVWELEGVQCGYNVTIFPNSLKYLPDIVEWCRNNIHKVQHISLVAFRAIPLTDGIEYMVNDRRIDPSNFQHSSTNLDKISISTDEMFEIVEKHFSDYRPCAYLNGTAVPESFKFLVTINIGSPGRMYGLIGAKTVELIQTFYHLFKGRYHTFLTNPKAGKKIFLLSVLDKETRRTLLNFLKAVIKNPLRIFDKIYVQSISLQQPNEFFNGKANLCDGCMNMMVYKGELIHSCRLDEYRMFGGHITSMKYNEKGPLANMQIRKRITHEL